MALINKLSAIGDAIREKTGKEELIKLEDMPSEIASISTGYSDEYISQILGGTCEHIYLSNVPEIAAINILFAQNTNLKTISLPDTEIIYGNSLCVNCSSLVSVEMPKLTAFNNACMFENCSALEYVCFPSVTGWTVSAIFRGCSSLKIVDMAEDTTTSAYYHNIPAHTFSGCSSLDTLILRSPQMWSLANATNIFTNTPIANGTGYIYVPKALIEQYKVATNWVTYANQFRAIEDYPEICGGAE